MRVRILVSLLGVGLGVGVGLAQEHAQHADHMEHRFDDAEAAAKNFDDPARDAWQMPGRVIEALKLKAGARVADVGAGTGYFSMRLAKAPGVAKVYAVDIEAAMVDYLAKRAAREGLKNVAPVQAGAASPNLPEAVDVVLVVDTYHHIPNRTAYFRGLAKSLRPGGRVAIIDFKKSGEQKAGVMGPPDEFRFTGEQIRGEMAEAGYRQVEEHGFLPNQQFLIFAAK